MYNALFKLRVNYTECWVFSADDIFGFVYANDLSGLEVA